MNLQELKEDVDFVIEQLHTHEKLDDIQVLITLSEPSIGARAFTRVTHVGLGFDWEHGQFRIEPERNIVKMGNTFNDAKEIHCKQYDGRNYYWCPKCEGKISKNDKYCRYCGQKLK